MVFLSSSRQKVNWNANSLELLRFFDKLFEEINDDPFFDVVKDSSFCYPFFLSISADEISVSDVTLQSIGELEDFNEEEDYVKFLQKENMSPMVPKLKADHKKLPLPVVTCEWSDKKSSESALSSYLPGLGSE